MVLSMPDEDTVPHGASLPMRATLGESLLTFATKEGMPSHGSTWDREGEESILEQSTRDEGDEGDVRSNYTATSASATERTPSNAVIRAPRQGEPVPSIGEGDLRHIDEDMALLPISGLSEFELKQKVIPDVLAHNRCRESSNTNTQPEATDGEGTETILARVQREKTTRRLRKHKALSSLSLCTTESDTGRAFESDHNLIRTGFSVGDTYNSISLINTTDTRDENSVRQDTYAPAWATQEAFARDNSSLIGQGFTRQQTNTFARSVPSPDQRDVPAPAESFAEVSARNSGFHVGPASLPTRPNTAPAAGNDSNDNGDDEAISHPKPSGKATIGLGRDIPFAGGSCARASHAGNQNDAESVANPNAAYSVDIESFDSESTCSTEEFHDKDGVFRVTRLLHTLSSAGSSIAASQVSEDDIDSTASDNTLMSQLKSWLSFAPSTDDAKFNPPVSVVNHRGVRVAANTDDGTHASTLLPAALDEFDDEDDDQLLLSRPSVDEPTTETISFEAVTPNQTSNTDIPRAKSENNSNADANTDTDAKEDVEIILDNEDGKRALKEEIAPVFWAGSLAASPTERESASNLNPKTNKKKKKWYKRLFGKQTKLKSMISSLRKPRSKRTKSKTNKHAPTQNSTVPAIAPTRHAGVNNVTTCQPRKLDAAPLAAAPSQEDASRLSILRSASIQESVDYSALRSSRQSTSSSASLSASLSTFVSSRSSTSLALSERVSSGVYTFKSKAGSESVEEETITFTAYDAVDADPQDTFEGVELVETQPTLMTPTQSTSSWHDNFLRGASEQLMTQGSVFSYGGIEATQSDRLFLSQSRSNSCLRSSVGKSRTTFDETSCLDARTQEGHIFATKSLFDTADSRSCDTFGSDGEEEREDTEQDQDEDDNTNSIESNLSYDFVTGDNMVACGMNPTETFWTSTSYGDLDTTSSVVSSEEEANTLRELALALTAASGDSMDDLLFE